MSFFRSSGLLAKIPGDIIGGTAMTFPKPGRGQPAEMKREVDVPGVGRMRITYELSSSRHGKSTNWYWRAVFAELAEA